MAFVQIIVAGCIICHENLFDPGTSQQLPFHVREETGVWTNVNPNSGSTSYLCGHVAHISRVVMQSWREMRWIHPYDGEIVYHSEDPVDDSTIDINYVKDKFRITCPICRPLKALQNPPLPIQGAVAETFGEGRPRQEENQKRNEEFYRIRLPALIQEQNEEMEKYIDWKGRILPLWFYEARYP